MTVTDAVLKFGLGEDEFLEDFTDWLFSQTWDIRLDVLEAFSPGRGLASIEEVVESYFQEYPTTYPRGDEEFSLLLLHYLNYITENSRGAREALCEAWKVEAGEHSLEDFGGDSITGDYYVNEAVVVEYIEDRGYRFPGLKE